MVEKGVMMPTTMDEAEYRIGTVYRGKLIAGTPEFMPGRRRSSRLTMEQAFITDQRLG